MLSGICVPDIQPNKKQKASYMAKSKSSAAPSGKRQHVATYARDKKKGGYIIRVEGPSSSAFAGREVPVSTLAGTEHTEKLIALIWTGKNKETNKPVSLYTFAAKPKGNVGGEAKF